MTDSSSEQEKSEEFLRLSEKSRKLERLMWDGQKKLLTAQDTEEAMEGIYEYYFFSAAWAQVSGSVYRLRGLDADDSKTQEHIEYALEDKKVLDEISQDGDWVEAKRRVANITDFSLGDEGFLVGTKISDEVEKKDIEAKVNLIPDKTESYTHPNLEQLKAQIASL